MDIDRLSAAARLLYGDDWQRPLARGLGPLHPDSARDSIDDRLVRRWASGERPVPGWVRGAVVEILKTEASARERQAASLRAEATSLAG